MVRRHEPNPYLAALLREAGWNGPQMARAVNALAATHGLTTRYDRTSVAHWLRGSSPRPPIPALVAQAFTARLGREVTVAATGFSTHPGPTPCPLPPSTAPPATQLAAVARLDADPAGHTFLTASPYDLTPPPVCLWPPASPGQGGPPSTDVPLTEVAGFFADLTERRGGEHGRTALAVYLTDTALPLLRRAGARERQGLLTALAQLTQILALMTKDSGVPPLAQRYSRIAYAFARQADDRVTSAIVLRGMAAQAHALGHHRLALGMAEQGLRIAPPWTPPPVRAYLHSGRAVVLASVGEDTEALREIVRAERHQSTSSGSPGPFGTYPDAALHYQRGQVLSAVTDFRSASSALRTSLALRPEQQNRPRSLTRARLAELHFQAGEVDAACVQWQVLLDELGGLQSAQLRQALVRLRRRADSFRRARTVKDVVERTIQLSGDTGGSG